jgi:hypothetical protein
MTNNELCTLYRDTEHINFWDCVGGPIFISEERDSLIYFSPDGEKSGGTWDGHGYKIRRAYWDKDRDGCDCIHIETDGGDYSIVNGMSGRY